MRGRHVIPVLAILALVCTSTGVQGQMVDRPLKIQLDVEVGIQVALEPEAPRLMPESGLARVMFPWVVTVPGPSFCLGDSITVEASIVDPPPHFIVQLSQASITKPFGEQGSIAPFVTLSPYPIGGWEFFVNVTARRLAPAFVPQTIALQAQALGGHGTSSGCSALDSEPFTLTADIRPDYWPQLQVLPDRLDGDEINFVVMNHGNGATRVEAYWVREATLPAYEGEKLADQPMLDPAAPEVFLESWAHSGEKAKVSQLVQVDRRNAPPDWTGDLLFVGRSDTPGEGLAEARVLISVGPGRDHALPATQWATLLGLCTLLVWARRRSLA